MNAKKTLPESERELAAYEAYKLQWMLEHGKTLHELIQCLQAVLDEKSEQDIPNLSALFEDWEFGVGFIDGSIWPCCGEFQRNELLPMG